MEVKFVNDGKTVYEIQTYHDGTEYRIKVRDCRNEAEARAVANYYRLRLA